MKTWQTTRIEDCLEKVVYTSKIQRKDFLASGKFPIVSQEESSINGYWNNKQDLFKVNTPLVVFGDHTQVLKYVDFDFVLGADGVKILQPKKFLDPKFFYYYLQSVDLRSLGYARHYRLLKEMKITYPESLPEQKRIVKVLDEVFEGINKAKANAEKNLANARELFESYLQEIFNKPQITQIKDKWEKKKLGDVCEIVNGGTPDTKVANYWNGKHLWITPKDMGQLDSIYVDDTARKITTAGLKNSSAKMLPINSAILSSRAPIGHLAINTKEISTNQGCRGIIPKKELLTLYLFYFLKSSVKLLNSLGSGTTFKELSGSKLAEVQIPLPNLSEQRAIVAKLDAISDQTKKLEAIYQQKLADLEELKKAVLKKAFEGEL